MECCNGINRSYLDSAFFGGVVDDSPVCSAGVSFLDDIVCQWHSTVILWRFPFQDAMVGINVCDLQRTPRWFGYICKVRLQRKVVNIHSLTSGCVEALDDILALHANKNF